MSETKDKDAIDDYLLKLSGKVALPEPIEIGNNFKVIIQGSVNEKREKDREDGGRIYTWIFEPIIVELLTETGKTLKARDTRGDSKLWRAQLYAKWKEAQLEIDSEEYYHYINAWLRRNADWIVEQAFKDKVEYHQ